MRKRRRWRTRIRKGEQARKEKGDKEKDWKFE